MSDSPVFVPPYVPSVRRPDTTRPHSRVPEGAAGPDRADDFDAPDGSGPAREGLPSHYRMRTEPHYVEALVEGRARPPAPSPPPETPTVTIRPVRATAAAAAGLAQAISSIETSLQELTAQGRPLRERVALELARAEAVRARWLAHAVGVLHREPLPMLDAVDLGVVLGEVMAAVGPEERLLGGAPRITLPDAQVRVFGDPQHLVAAVGSLVHALSAMAGERGHPIRLSARVVAGQDTTTRAIEVVDAAVRLSASARARFFDADWADHPAGPTGALLLAAARRVALAQGGSLEVTALAAGGCRLVLSMPAAD